MFSFFLLSSNRNRFDNVKYLLEQGAEPDAMSANVDATALYMAATKGYFQTVYNLLQHGADVNMKVGQLLFFFTY